MDHRRPGLPTRVTSTPSANSLIDLLGGGERHESVTLSTDEMKHVRRLYQFVEEPPQSRPPEPEKPKPPTGDDRSPAAWKAHDEAMRAYEEAKRAWDTWRDPRVFMQAGADRNAFRYAAADGLRIVAWLARYMEPGADPLKTIVQLACENGFDVDPEDSEWAFGEEEG